MVVAIVGKPNVGKSSLFNRIAGRRIAITDSQPGVTRDRLYATCSWNGKNFSLIDTGGIETNSFGFQQQIKIQAQIAIEEADVIIFVLDGREEPTADEHFIASILRKSNKNILVALNKAENLNLLNTANYSIGFEKFFPLSALHGVGVGDLLDEVLNSFGKEVDKENESFKLAIIGKPNVGKSSLLNWLVGENRSIVSEIPGTTRDSVHAKILIDEQECEIIDTAGLLRKSKLLNSVEHYALIRALNSLEESNLTLLLLSAEEKITHFHKRIAGFAFELKKPIILVISKQDLFKNYAQEQSFKKSIKDNFGFLDWAPLVSVSVVGKKGLAQLKETIKSVKENISRVFSPHLLSSFINEIQLLKPAPTYRGKRLYIQKIKQLNGKIPTLMLTVNNKFLAHFSYIRYIENQLRHNFQLSGTAVKLILKDAKDESL